MKFELTYRDYLRARSDLGRVDENGVEPKPMSEDDFNALDDDTRMGLVGGGFALQSSDPRWKEYADVVGETDPDRAIWIGRENNFSTNWMIDPNRIGKTENGYAFSTQGNESAENQARNDFGPVQHGWALVLGGGLLANAAMGAAGATGAEAGSTGLVDTLGGGTAETGFASTPAATGVTAPAATGITAPAAGTPAAVTAPAAVNPFAGAVATGSTSSPGIVGSVMDGATSLSNWYGDLSPAARLVVNQGISTGVQGITGTINQRNAQQAADEQQRQQEEDRIRRTTVTRFAPGAFTPRPGLIGSRFTPRGG